MEKLMRQVARFGAVGFAAFAIDYATLMTLTQVAHVDALVAAAVAFCVSVAFNYLASMRFVFRRRDDLSRTRELATFVVLSLVGLAINEAMIWLGTLAFGTSAVPLTATKVTATAVVMVWNFLSRRRWLEKK